MTRRLLRFLLPLLAVAAATLPMIWACTPEGPSLAFTWATHPDLPLNGFADGRLGILQPTFARSYLVVAYRHLNGSPLTRSESAGALSLWEARLQGGVVPPTEPAPEPAPEPASTDPAEPRQLLDWKKVRAKHTREPVPEPVRFGWDESFYRPQVLDSALEVAASTLADRAKRWKPAQVAEWIRAQDLVFATQGKSQPAFISPTPGRDLLFQQDRAYQRACASFYAGDFEAARAGFSGMAQDPASPWRRLAAYLVGRTWLGEAVAAKDSTQARRCYEAAHGIFKGLREGGLPSKPQSSAPEPLPEAELLKAIEAGEQRALACSDPEAAAMQMVRGLLTPEGSKDFGDLLGRYTNLLDANIRGESGYAEEKKPRAFAAGFLKEDLTEWVFQFRATGPQAYALARQRWNGGKGIHWLLMALMNGEPSSEGIQEIMEAGAALHRTHPGFESVAFHRARLFAAQGKQEEARAIATAFLGTGAAPATPSSLNLWRALRMTLASDQQAFLADALRTPIGAYGYGDEADHPPSELNTQCAGIQSGHPDIKKQLKGVQVPPRFIEGDAAKILNLQTPADVLLQLARKPELPAHLRREWLRAAWVRAALLERWDLAAEATPDLLKDDSDLRPGLEGFVQASTEERSRIALLTLLRHPGLRWMVFPGINHRTFTEPGDKPLPLKHRDTFLGACWWPGPRWGRRDGFQEEAVSPHSWGALFYYPQPHAMEQPLFALVGGKSLTPRWLTPEQRERGEAEGRKLVALDEAPDWLGERALAWALASPRDPRVPEALHHAVRAEKVGGVKGYGAMCFKLLHARYKQNPWTVKTPIHY